MPTTMTTHDHQLDRLARKRASSKMRLYIHAGVYVLVNLLLAALAATGNRHWAVFPAVGWGIGLAIHAFIVYVVNGSAGLRERLVAHERNLLSLQRDPW